jgi:radical SAM superfamily enzyme YgiQ (UPF0313 family)
MPGTVRSSEARLRPVSTVTLLRPPVVVLPGALATHGPTPPIGAAYVAAALREAGHQVDLIDGAGEAIDQTVEIDSPVGRLEQIGLSLDEIVDRIDPETDIVGITTMFLHEWPLVRDLAALVKARFPDVYLLLGGENATAFAPWILEQSEDVDACVLGEGEATMVAIAEHLAEDKPLHGLTGVAFRDQVAGDVVDTGLSIRLTKPELNATVPLPAWDLVPLESYWEHYPFFGVYRGRSMNVLGTRGCPYKCTFCSSPQMWTTKYVVREPEDVVDEIVGYVERFGITNVNFVDLTAATNRKWTLGLCDALEARAPGVTWQLPVGTRIEAIDREVLQRLWDTGCRNVTFAPESGSERLLEVMDKRVKLDKVLDAVREGNQIGLRTMINVLIGHPDETWSDLRKSVRFSLKAAWQGCSDTAVMMFCPYPGSADFEALVSSGRHTIDEAAYYVGLSRGSAAHRSWNEHISARQLRMMQLVMIAGFYVTSWIRRPWRAVAFLKAQLGGTEDTYLDQMVRTKRKNLDHLSRRDQRRVRRADEASPPPEPREPALAQG